MREAGWLAWLSLLSCAGAGYIRAQPAAAGMVAATTDEIRLELGECPLVSGSSVRELVALEVAPRRVLAVASSATAATRADVSCLADVAHIRVEDAGLTAPLHLEIALRDLDRPARSRLLALAVAELIATSRLQRAKTAAPAGASDLGAGARDSDGAEAAAVSGEGAGSVSARSAGDDAHAAEGFDDELALADGLGPVGAQLWLGLGAARLAEPSMIAPAAAGGVSVYWNAVALNADVRFERARTTRSVAELQLDAGSLALAAAWRVHSRSAALSIGPGLRAGYASLRAREREAGLEGQAVNGFWVAPCAQLALQLRFAERWAVRIGSELAFVTRTLRGNGPNGDAVLELRGFALAAQLGISWDAIATH